MQLTTLQNKNICIVGCGKEGQAMLNVLEENNVTHHITLADGNAQLAFTTKYPTQLGEQWLQNLERFDYIIVSPGVPPCSELDAVADKVTTSTQIFLTEAKERGSTVIGVTGSKGKSTVSSLIYTILHTSAMPTYLVGNIGIPSVEYISKAAPGVIFVLEMSSYQLLRCTTSPRIAVVTSFFADHLDYHSQESKVRNVTDHDAKHTAALEAYKRAKMHSTKYQSEDDIVFYDTLTPGAKEIAMQSPGKKVATSAEDSPVTLGETKLIGEHNLRNIGLAYSAAKYFNIDTPAAIEAIKNFTGLPHRLQSVGIYNDIEWIDDAISTTPEAAIAAIDALKDRVQTIILGGLDRDNDFSALGARIVDSAITTVILFPASGARIKQAITTANTSAAGIQFFDADSMQAAVQLSKKHTQPVPGETPIVLLSTASPSYNMFKNFEDKGEQFAHYCQIT